MKERPIIMQGPDVLATQAKLKSQTRRVVKPQPARRTPGNVQYWWQKSKRSSIGAETEAKLRVLMEPWCPFGAPGDELWVRETWNLCRTYWPDASTPLPPQGRPYIFVRGGHV